MKFGVRECANIVFRAKQVTKIADATFQIGQPVLYIDSATTSTLEQATTTVYAQGGRGNTRLIAWQGEKTLTFSFTDALLSPIGFSILSGAGLFKHGDGNQGNETKDWVHFHMTSGASLTISGTTGTVDLRDVLSDYKGYAEICVDDAPIYIMETEDDGSLTGRLYSGSIDTTQARAGKLVISNIELDGQAATRSAAVMVDYYIDLPGKNVYEADITPDTFGGNYYVEADTLFRDQYTGKDLPANLTFPNVKIQSNFTMTFAGTGDPSTFDFTMDAFPGYTYFNKSKKVLCVLQVIDAVTLGIDTTMGDQPVMPHNDVIEHLAELANDSDVSHPVISVTSLEIYPSTAFNLLAGRQIRIEAVTDPDGAPVTYSSSDEAKATIDQQGILTAVAAGNSTITVTSGTLTKTVQVTVTAN